MIQDSFNIEAKVMETSDSVEWECKLFTHEFLGFQDKENMEIKLQINTSYFFFTISSNT